MKQQRRVFLKVIAIGPLVGCGPDPSAPHGLGVGGGNTTGGSAGTGSNPSASGAGNTSFGGAGNTSFGGAGNTSLGGAGNTSVSGGSSMGGSPIATGGQSGANTAGGASPGGTSSAGSDPNDPETPIGNVSAFPLGSFSIAGSIFFLGHDAGGLYAMSMQCTHAGCAVDLQGTALNCPCHGSRFDHLGNVLQGPATKPLPHYPVIVDATGNITIDRFTVVSMSARTPV